MRSKITENRYYRGHKAMLKDFWGKEPDKNNLYYNTLANVMIHEIDYDEFECLLKEALEDGFDINDGAASNNSLLDNLLTIKKREKDKQIRQKNWKNAREKYPEGWEREKYIKVLLDNGANSLTPDDMLHKIVCEVKTTAVYKNDCWNCPIENEIKLLLEYGADPNSRNKDGYTPIDSLVKSDLIYGLKKSRSLEKSRITLNKILPTIELLLNAGAEPCVSDCVFDKSDGSDGDIIQWARKEREDKVKKILEDYFKSYKEEKYLETADILQEGDDNLYERN